MSSYANIDVQDIQQTHLDRSSFPAQSSVIDERALFHRVIPLFDLPGACHSCRFLTRGDSDIYRVLSGSGTYYLKIRRPPVSTARCDAEARLVVDLADGGVPMVRPVPLRRGGYAVQIQASEGPRAVLLFEAAPPARVETFDNGLARQFGSMLAKLHEVADRRSIDPDLGEADAQAAYGWVREIAAGAALTDEERATLNDAAERVVKAYSSLPRRAPDFGAVHGDPARSNIRSGDGGCPMLFDFGAAELGWRINELANVWRQTLPRPKPGAQNELWPAFLDGYASIRPVSAGLDDFRQYNILAAKLSTMAYICGRLTLRLGIEPIEENKISQQTEEVKQMVTKLRRGEAT